MVEGRKRLPLSEARAAGINWTFAPMVDIARDPRWGRIVEGAGEDPYLVRRCHEHKCADFRVIGSVALNIF